MCPSFLPDNQDDDQDEDEDSNQDSDQDQTVYEDEDAGEYQGRR